MLKWMLNIDELINAIISKNPKVSRETILKRLEEERRKSSGLISDEVLLRMVAAQFGVEVSNVVSAPSLAVNSLVPGLNNVSVVGRVIAVYPSKTLGKTVRSRYASVLVADKSGTIRVILWDDKAELVNSGEIKAGHIVEFSRGYTREGRLGRVELHISGKADVKILGDVETEGYPTVAELATKIGEITSTLKNKRINIVGEVKGALRESAFERENSTPGKVLRFVLADETGEVPVVAWNEKVDEAKKVLKKGATLQIVNAKVKGTLNGNVEIHVDREAYIDILTSPKRELWKIAELKEGMKNISVQGTVATKPFMRSVKTAKDKPVKLTVFEIKDETGGIWVSAWDKNAEKTANLKPGEKIAIKNADVKKGFADQLEIRTRSTTIIEILSKESKN